MEFIDLKAQQLRDRQQQDSELAKQIEEVKRRVAQYAERFKPTGATIEPDKSLVRLGIKRANEDRVVRL